MYPAPKSACGHDRRPCAETSSDVRWPRPSHVVPMAVQSSAAPPIACGCAWVTAACVGRARRGGRGHGMRATGATRIAPPLPRDPLPPNIPRTTARQSPPVQRHSNDPGRSGAVAAVRLLTPRPRERDDSSSSKIRPWFSARWRARTQTMAVSSLQLRAGQLQPSRARGGHRCRACLRSDRPARHHRQGPAGCPRSVPADRSPGTSSETPRGAWLRGPSEVAGVAVAASRLSPCGVLSGAAG